MMGSEDPKKELHEDSREASSKPFVGIALLIISLLLAATVAALIYQNVSAATAANSGQQDSVPCANEPAEVETSVTINSNDDNTQVKTDIKYAKNVAYYYGDDGSFEADDFGKGIHITRSKLNNICYLFAVGTGNRSTRGERDFEQMLRDIEGTELRVSSDGKGDAVQRVIMPGKVTDTGFLPPDAHRECTSGYQWMSFVSTPESASSSGLVKRQTRIICHHWECTLMYDYWDEYEGDFYWQCTHNHLYDYWADRYGNC